MSEFDPTLSEAQVINAAFDAENNNSGTRYHDKELHIGLHLIHAIDKLMYTVKEKTDHPLGWPNDSVIDDEVIPDLLKYSLQLAEIRGQQAARLLLKRYQALEARNNTSGSTERAINSVREKR
jgi:hypothetical protein